MTTSFLNCEVIGPKRLLAYANVVLEPRRAAMVDGPTLALAQAVVTDFGLVIWDLDVDGPYPTPTLDYLKLDYLIQRQRYLIKRSRDSDNTPLWTCEECRLVAAFCDCNIGDQERQVTWDQIDKFGTLWSKCYEGAK